MRYSSDKAVLKFAAFLKDLPEFKYDAKNPHFKNQYLSLNGLLDLLEPVLQTHNGFLTHGIQSDVGGDNILVIEFIFIENEEAFKVTSSVTIPQFDNPQTFGSYLTYAKRYAILSALGKSADEDDDGESVASTMNYKPVTTTKRRGLTRNG